MDWGSVIAGGIAGGAQAGLSQLEREYRMKADIMKAEALDDIIRNRSRDERDALNNERVYGYDKDTGLARTNKWVSEHGDEGLVGREMLPQQQHDYGPSANMREFEMYRKMPDGPEKERFGRMIGAIPGRPGGAGGGGGQGDGGVDQKSWNKFILDVSKSKPYLQYVEEVNKYNEDSSWLPGKQERTGKDRKPLMSPAEYAEKVMGVSRGGAGSTGQSIGNETGDILEPNPLGPEGESVATQAPVEKKKGQKKTSSSGSGGKRRLSANGAAKAAERLLNVSREKRKKYLEELRDGVDEDTYRMVLSMMREAEKGRAKADEDRAYEEKVRASGLPEGMTRTQGGIIVPPGVSRDDAPLSGAFDQVNQWDPLEHMADRGRMQGSFVSARPY